ncbi:uncharacterized protein [Watersipora subatra]|uniref:uncharacterized protein n=1 Tax=Watersipora subatra TaxID=2589382 RepID=UPI00355BFADD
METVKAGNFNVKLEIDAIENKSEDKDSQFKFDYDLDNEKEMNRVSSRDKYKSRGYGKDRKSSKYNKDYSKVRSSRDYISSSRDSVRERPLEWRRRSRDRYSPRRYDDRSSKNSRRYSSPGADKCYGCGVRGHEIRFCPEVRCFFGATKGHTIKDCKVRRSQRRDRYESSGSSEGRRSPTPRVRFSESSNSS